MKINSPKFFMLSVLFSFAFLSDTIVQDTLAEEAYSFKTLNVIAPFDTHTNLYQQIQDEINLEYENIGKRESARVLKNTNTSVTGGLNSIGFSYQRPFIDFSISVDRNLAPDLFDSNRWIITDKFSIYIDASRVMSKLKDQKIIDITEKNLAAFAGIVFKRTYTWIHFSSSYNEGLTTHFEKLFLPFIALQFDKIANLEKDEMIFKEDSLSIKAGGMVTAPLYPGISGMAGILAKFEQISRIEVVSMLNANSNEAAVHLSFEKTKVAQIQLSLGIEADFLKIIRLTLLSYDFSYELDSSYKIYLNFPQKSLKEMAPNGPEALEIRQLLKNREGNLTILSPYIISEEKKIAQTIKHKYNFLLMGGVKSSRTQQIEVTTDNRVKIFFRHYYEKIKYTEDLLSRFFSSVIYAITNTDLSAAKLASDSKKVTIEYDSDRNLLENHEGLNTKDGQQKISMSFNGLFETKRSTGSSGKKYRERAIYILEHYSGIDSQVVPMVENETLVAPFSITGQYLVNSDGVHYFNSLSIGQVFDYISGLCEEYPRNSFFNFRNLFDHCRRSLQGDYIDYFKDLSHEKITANYIDKCESKSQKYIFKAAKKRAFLKDCLFQITIKDRDDWQEIPLWALKNFANNLVNNSNNKVDYYNLFGVQNVFFYGNFTAATSDGQGFTTSFHEGDFKGLGAVDHYMRLENLRAPSSVVIDQ